MNANRNLFLIAAIIGIGIFVLPSTLSMFAGQHSWYNPNNNGIPCDKCHFLEKEELAASGGPHDPDYTGLLNLSAPYNMTNSGEAGGTDFWVTNTVNDRCYGCHQTTGSNNSTNTVLSGSWADHQNYQHAAVAVWCIDCHPWVENELTNASAAHKAFYEDLEGGATITGLQNPNQACLGCHTHVGVNLSWTRNEYVSYNVTCNSSGYAVDWNTTDDLGTNTSRFQSVAGY